MIKYPRVAAVCCGLLIALAASPSAWATDKPAMQVKPPAPMPTPSYAAQALANAQAQAAGGQATGGTGGSVGDVTNTANGGQGGQGGNGGQGGAGGSVGDVTGGSATSLNTPMGGDAQSSATGGTSYSASEAGDVSNMIGGSKFLSLPQPVWTTVPTPYGCLVTEAKAGAIGWNLVSGSGSKQYSDAVCTTVRMAEAAYLHCQYLTAAYLNRRAFETMHPGESGEFFLAGSPQNLDPVSCDALKRPVLRMTPTVQQVAAAPAAPSVTSVNVGMSCPQPAAPAARPASRPVHKPKPAAPTCTSCCK